MKRNPDPLMTNDEEGKIAERIILEVFEQGEDSGGGLEDVKNAHSKGSTLSSLSNMKLIAVYRDLVQEGRIPDSTWIQRLLRKRTIRTLSGISPISVFTKPYPCPGQCVYCPTERVPDHGKTLFELDSEKKHGKQKIPKKYKKIGALVMPKSYLSSEPAAMKALLNAYDPWKQVKNRIRALEEIGHNPEKCELIVIGGTFSFLPRKYQTWFMRRCLQAFNGDHSPNRSFSDAVRENETAKHRAIGIVFETRPDFISPDEVRRMRKLGGTRVEMGVQTLDDEVSKYTKRGHGRKESAVATKILRDAGFEICHHMMPGLPGSTPEKDVKSFRELYADPDFKPDYLKIYPCVVTPFSELEAWHKEGKFIPLTEDELIPLLLTIKSMTPPWVRISRLIRDIPGTAIIAGSKVTNLRQILEKKMNEKGLKCECIRCREIRDTSFHSADVILMRREYDANGGKEIFLSYELKNGKIISLLRLRIPSWFFPEDPGIPIFPVLQKSSIVRELHTYGELIPVEKKDGHSQHRGWGKKLLKEAERISQEEYGITSVAVIAGIGAREYYRKFGYEEVDTYMVKNIAQ